MVRGYAVASETDGRRRRGARAEGEKRAGRLAGLEVERGSLGI